MGRENRLHSKLQSLFKIFGPSQRAFAELSGIPKATVADYFSKGRNISADTFLKILSAFGIDLEPIVDERTNEVLNKVTNRRNRDNEDLVIIFEHLDKSHRRELITTAVNLSKMKKNNKLTEVIERIEKRQLH